MGVEWMPPEGGHHWCGRRCARSEQEDIAPPSVELLVRASGAFRACTTALIRHTQIELRLGID